MNIITIDCGASFLKGALFKDTRLVKQTQQKAPAVNANDLRAPTQINRLIKAVRSMFRELAHGHSEVVLGISNEMHGFILTDEEGTPYTDYVSWQKEFGKFPLAGKDEITALQILADEKYCQDIKKTGMPLRSGLPSVNLLYLRYNFNWAKNKKMLRFFTLGDFIIFALSGKVSCCHPSNAAATGLMNLDTGAWNETLVSLTAGSQIQFPDICVTGISFDFEGIHVYALPAIGDQQASLLGAGLKDKNEISFNLGTGAQVSCLIDDLKYSPSYQIRPYFGNKYIKTIPHLPSGRALNVYFRFIKEVVAKFSPEIDDNVIWQWILESVKTSEVSAMKCDLSFFDNPLTDKTKGGIEDIGEYDFNVGNLFGTVFRQMVDNFMKAARIIMPDDCNPKKIVFSGGIARKISFIRNEILKNFDADIESSMGKDETFYGLAQYAKEQG